VLLFIFAHCALRPLDNGHIRTQGPIWTLLGFVR